MWTYGTYSKGLFDVKWTPVRVLDILLAESNLLLVANKVEYKRYFLYLMSLSDQGYFMFHGKRSVLEKALSQTWDKLLALI